MLSRLYAAADAHGVYNGDKFVGAAYEPCGNAVLCDNIERFAVVDVYGADFYFRITCSRAVSVDGSAARVRIYRASRSRDRRSIVLTAV